ncbi:unnamed protein product [Mytilus coruscus]|uniref:MAM domain-containing protein n=1 Tax=Mytilus coruscus TaxID=42192 RepID=A0A6J8ABB0_MYTCO|nr:unnamed protein product [Mytilus coruscus]
MLYCIAVLYFSGLTKKCLASNGVCGTKDLTCTDSFGGGWINEGRCCYEKPCCKIEGYSCGFETDAPCIFQDSTKDEFDWTRRANSTGTSRTGPTSAAEGNYYLYTEASFPRRNGDRAILTTEAASLPASSWCLTFQYHMKGRDIGKLEVFAGEKLSNLTSIWEKTGEQPDPDLWKSASITIPQYTNSVITIEGSTSTSFIGDIAIDDITLNAGTCRVTLLLMISLSMLVHVVSITSFRGDNAIDNLILNAGTCKVTLPLMISLSMLVHVVSITSFRGDIAIDDLTLNAGTCKVTLPLMITLSKLVHVVSITSFRGDIAIDDITLNAGTCKVTLLLMITLSILVHIVSITTFRSDIAIDDLTLNSGTCKVTLPLVITLSMLVHEVSIITSFRGDIAIGDNTLNAGTCSNYYYFIQRGDIAIGDNTLNAGTCSKYYVIQREDFANNDVNFNGGTCSKYHSFYHPE